MQSNNAEDKEPLSPKIIELRKKIQDENYINSAIARIALVLSRQIVENHIAKSL